MMRRAAAAILASCFASAAAAQAEGVARLGNEDLAVVVSLRTGAIESVERKASGFEHRNPGAEAGIVDLRVPLAEWEGHSVSGADADAFEVVEESSDSLVLKLGPFAGRPQSWPLEVEIRYRLDRDNLVASLSLTNRSDRPVDRIAFPVFGVAPAGDGSETLTMASGPLPLTALFSGNRVRAHHDPFKRLDGSDLRSWWSNDAEIPVKGFAYPGYSALRTAWMSYAAGGESVGFDVRDSSFQSQYAVVERVLQRDSRDAAANRYHYVLAWHWFPLVPPGASWQSPEVWLKFSGADWHRVARQHREWLDSWIRKPDPPEAFRSSLGWISQGVTSFDQIPAIASKGVAVGAPYFIVYGWFGFGMHHLSYDYFPRNMLGGVEGLRRNLAAARAAGAYPMAWYNGTTTVDSAPEHLRYGKDWLAVDRYGGLQIDGRWSLFGPDRPQVTDDSVVHLNYDMGAGAGEFVIESVRRLIEEYGFSGVELDQAGKNFLSYAAASRSRPELSYTEGARPMFERIVEIVRAGDPNGIVVGEGMSDFMNQYVDSSWIFEGGGGIFTDPRGWVEITSFLRYSLPWVQVPVRAVATDRGHANRAFMLNAPLDIFDDLDAFPDYAAQLKRLHALKREVHPLLYGGAFSDEEGFALGGHDPKAVLAKSYVAPDRIAVVVINTSGEPREATVTFAEPAADPEVRVWRLDREPATQRAETGVALRLDPWDVVVLARNRGTEGAR